MTEWTQWAPMILLVLHHTGWEVDVVILNPVCLQPGNLPLSLTSQHEQPNNNPVSSELLAGPPNLTQFIVVQNPFP